MGQQWSLKGLCAEVCTCEAACPCIFLSPPSKGECIGVIFWRIDEGHDGDVRLDGLNVALGLHSPGRMADGGWRVALYIDRRADARQQESLQRIYAGEAGGHPANLKPLIAEIMGVASVPITFEETGSGYHVDIAAIANADFAAIEGQDGEPVTIQGHPLAVAPGHVVTAARSSHFCYDDHDLFREVSDRNVLVSGFSYAA